MPSNCTVKSCIPSENPSSLLVKTEFPERLAPSLNTLSPEDTDATISYTPWYSHDTVVSQQTTYPASCHLDAKHSIPEKVIDKVLDAVPPVDNDATLLYKATLMYEAHVVPSVQAHYRKQPPSDEGESTLPYIGWEGNKTACSNDSNDVKQTIPVEGFQEDKESTLRYEPYHDNVRKYVGPFQPKSMVATSCVVQQTDPTKTEVRASPPPRTMTPLTISPVKVASCHFRKASSPAPNTFTAHHGPQIVRSTIRSPGRWRRGVAVPTHEHVLQYADTVCDTQWLVPLKRRKMDEGTTTDSSEKQMWAGKLADASLLLGKPVEGHALSVKQTQQLTLLEAWARYSNNLLGGLPNVTVVEETIERE